MLIGTAIERSLIHQIDIADPVAVTTANITRLSPVKKGQAAKARSDSVNDLPTENRNCNRIRYKLDHYP